MAYKNLDEEEDTSEKDIKTLSRAEVLEIFNEKDLSPRVTSPWQVVTLQCILTFAFTMIALLSSLIFDVKNHALSVLLGGSLGFVPGSMFIIRVQAFKKTLAGGAKRFISTWIYAEVIKITLTLTIIIFVIRLYPDLEWISFLGMFFITLQAYWLVGFIKIVK
jgi:F0F1-type ATP synthase assembly protein I